MSAVYTTEVTVSGGRESGHARSSDGALDVSLAVPKELGGNGAVATNPEQLFAAGYGACFESAVRALASAQGKTVEDSSVTATVRLEPNGSGGFKLAVDLRVSLTGVSREDAQALADRAHERVCPYSQAVRGNVDVDVAVV